ncbi:MAG: hypothetical protein AAGC43_04610 [Bacteroidota bacterium]
MACNKKITANILFDCADAPIKGLDGQKAVIINYDDIDRAALAMNGATITDLATKSGTSGFSIEWYKELASVASSFTANAEDVDGFAHSFQCRLANSDANNAERANELKNGRFVVVVESTYKGAAQASAFKVYGIDAGLELSEMTGNSNENGGSQIFTLSTREGTVERYPYSIFLETDYAASKASFDTSFATP